MVDVGFAVTFCCQELHMAMIKREWWFEIDTNNSKVILVFAEQEEITREDCPFCHRNISDDVVDVDIKEDEM